MKYPTSMDVVMNSLRGVLWRHQMRHRHRGTLLQTHCAPKQSYRSLLSSVVDSSADARSWSLLINQSLINFRLEPKKAHPLFALIRLICVLLHERLILLSGGAWQMRLRWIRLGVPFLRPVWSQFQGVKGTRDLILEPHVEVCRKKDQSMTSQSRPHISSTIVSHQHRSLNGCLDEPNGAGGVRGVTSLAFECFKGYIESVYRIAEYALMGSLFSAFFLF